MGFAYAGLSPQALIALEQYAWPGNIRELENMMERATVLCRGQSVDMQHLPADLFSDAQPTPAADKEVSGLSKLRLQPQIELLERRLIEQSLQTLRVTRQKQRENWRSANARYGTN